MITFNNRESGKRCGGEGTYELCLQGQVRFCEVETGDREGESEDILDGGPSRREGLETRISGLIGSIL